MKSSNLTHVLVLFLVILVAPLALQAQSSQTGFPPFGSFQPGGFDSVNLQDLNVNFNIPVGNSPGRGLNLNFFLSYNSLIYELWGTSWIPLNRTGNPSWGWMNLGPAGSLNYTIGTASCQYKPFGQKNFTTEYFSEYSNYTFTDPQGTVHPFPETWYDMSGAPNCLAPNGHSNPYYNAASDNSGIYLSPSSSTVYQIIYPNGTIQNVNNGSSEIVVDANGNYLSQTSTGWTDSVGRAAMNITAGTTSTTYQFYDPTGHYQTVTVTYSSYDIATNFACSGVSEFTNSAGVNLPSQISLPNGQSYTFTYEQTPGSTTTTTGRISQITLPTGGYYQYSYSGPNDGINCSNGSVLGMTRTYNDGTNTSQWTYARTGVSGAAGTTTVTAPQMPYDSAANQSVYTFSSSGLQTQVQVYQGSSSSGTLLETVNTTAASNGTPATQITILPVTNQQSKIAATYDSNGNLDQKVEYDWGSGAPGAVLRTTNFTWANLLGFRLTQKTIVDSTGTTQYFESRAYDGATPTCLTGVVQHDDTNYGCSYNTRNNLTSITTYTNASAQTGAITKSFTYNTLGNLLTASVGGTLQSQYNYSATTEYESPDSIVSGPSGGTQLTTSFTYNAYTSQIATSTDPNGLVTSYSYDFLRRPLSVTRPDGTQLSAAYNDSALTITSTTPVDNTPHSTVQVVAYDGLARPVTTTLKDASGNVYSIVQKQYDLIGRGYKISDPYTSSPSYWTTSQFDALSRSTKTIQQDGSQTTSSYISSTSGPALCAQQTDPVGKQSEQCMDGLGRVTSVYEPDPTNGNSLTLQTSYVYNPMNQLTQVTQGSQTRTYVYDGVGRPTSSTTPEAGQVAFTYNNFSQVASLTDARGVITSYTYDTLNRLTQTSYNVGTTGVAATSSVNNTYDQGGSSAYALGRLTSMTDGVGSETYTYDKLGRRTQLQKVIGSTTYTTSYSYNLANQITQITYPSGRQVQQAVDAIGRLSSIADNTPATYESGFSYNTAQQVTGFTYGNGVTASFGYSSDRLQLTSLAYANSSGNIFSLSYAYGSSGSNDGLISSITDNVDNGRSATYTYDSLYRLSAAVTPGSTNYPAWGLSWTYDRYGNRTAQSIASGCTGITCPTNSLTVSATTNQITGTGVGYDPSGNMTGDGLNTLTYDAAGRLISSSNGSTSGTYSYDGKGHRVQKGTGSTTTVYIFSGGKVLAEYDNGAAVSSPTREYVYSGGKMIARIAGATTTYYHSDYLSTRVITNSSGAVVEQLGHFAFGEPWYDTGTEKYKFTTYERDAESGTGGGTGNDYAMARYNVNRLGRFSSPDPLSGSVITPQSLNHYAYAGNNPINAIDPTGRDDLMVNPDDCGDLRVLETPDCGGDPIIQGNYYGGGVGGNGGGESGGGSADGNFSNAPTPNPTGQCAYFDNSGTGIESIDPNSSQDECSASGGNFAPGSITGFSTDPNSNAIILQYTSSTGSVAYEFQAGMYLPPIPVSPGGLTPTAPQPQPNQMGGCTFMEEQAVVATGVAGGMEVAGLAADAGIITIPFGISMHLAGAGTLLAAGLWGAAGAVGKFAGWCQ